VTEAQGYLFSRPVPAAQMRHLLNASHGRRSLEPEMTALAVLSIA
jgi:predicted signal transduction protein with EAL and GGDEF domain